MSIGGRHGGTSIGAGMEVMSIGVVYEVSLLLLWCYCCMCVLSVVLLYEVVCVTNIVWMRCVPVFYGACNLHNTTILQLPTYMQLSLTHGWCCVFRFFSM